MGMEVAGMIIMIVSQWIIPSFPSYLALKKMGSTINSHGNFRILT
jgi:hypothetical protein